MTMPKIIAALFSFALIFSGCVFSVKTPTAQTPPVASPTSTEQTTSGLTAAEAQEIAEASCIKGGGALEPGYYNEGTKTWWFDANLNATREGCNPACVVSEETKTAEINWRCTGLQEPATPPADDTCTCPNGYRKDGDACNPECYYSTPACMAPSVSCQKPTTGAKCGLENCHGMDMVCGPNPVEICTEIYMAGDNCRQFASCETTNGKCQLAKSPKFDACKSCVEKCTADNKDNPTNFFQCESKCTQ